MAINFSARVMVTNPTLYHLGRAVTCIGIIAIVAGVICHFVGEVVLPGGLLCAVGIPATVAGVMIAQTGLTKN